MIKFTYNTYEKILAIAGEDNEGNKISEKINVEISDEKHDFTWMGLKETLAELCGLYLEQHDLDDVEYMISIRTH